MTIAELVEQLAANGWSVGWKTLGDAASGIAASIGSASVARRG